MSTQQEEFEKTGQLNRVLLDNLEKEILAKFEAWYKMDARTPSWWEAGKVIQALAVNDNTFLVNGYYNFIIQNRLKSLKSTSLCGTITEVIGRVAEILKSERELCSTVFPPKDGGDGVEDSTSQAFKGVVSTVIDDTLLPIINSDELCNYNSIDDIVELVTQIRRLEGECGLVLNEAWTERAKNSYMETEMRSMNSKFKGVLKKVSESEMGCTGVGTDPDPEINLTNTDFPLNVGPRS